ncbi:uncharacterized protein LOC144037719 isoform X2 [Vanacampus margaritifer]
MATLRRFSSEGSILDLDFFSWGKVDLKRTEHDKHRKSGTYSPYVAEFGEDAGQIPTIQEPGACTAGKHELIKELSVSAENLRDLEKKSKKHLEVCAISEGCRAYSDSQLAPDAKGSTESVERDDLPSPAYFNAFSLKSQHRQHNRAKLSAAKLHLKSLFGQSPHSSNSNLANTEHKDSAKERRSRLLFMRQWSQVGHSRKHLISREEIEKWAESLDNLLANQSEHRQQDQRFDHPAAAGSLSHVSVPCTEAHLLTPGPRLLPPLPPVYRLPCFTARGRLAAACVLHAETVDAVVMASGIPRGVLEPHCKKKKKPRIMF